MLVEALLDRCRRALGDPALVSTFLLRWQRYEPELSTALEAVYPERASEVLDRILDLALAATAARPQDLRVLDEARLLTPDWLQKPDMVGYVAYADRFAGSLRGIEDHLDHLDDLGVRYLHLMPLLKPRPGENDGGYAVMDYRTVREDLGTMGDLERLTAKLREHRISLVVDLVLNHVAKEHEWARRATAGEQRYRNYFFIHPDRAEPDAYEQTLPEVFPDFAPGNFTWDDELDGWVWTTFNSYQWDVNWANPDVFCEFLDVILMLANRGVEVVRLDAIAFIWKQLGTTCQNLPQVHDLTQALRAACRIVAPALAFKAEAIVGPDDLIDYLGTHSHHGKISDMAYHNSLMVQLWSSLASRDTRLMEAALGRFGAKPTNTTWGTYVRCHDDIGWAITDEDAAAVGLDGFWHRSFLSDFYSGQHEGSFARGLVFQANPATGDRRISGTLASLAGLEAALQTGDQQRVWDAVDRINLLHAAILGFGGIPLIFMGDEFALLNDHGFAEDPAHAGDNRWAHRPQMPWALAEGVRNHGDQPAGWVHQALRHMVRVRGRTVQLHAATESRVLPSPDPRILLLVREHPEGTMVQLYNFSEQDVHIPMGTVRDQLGDTAVELLGGHDYDLRPPTLTVPRLGAMWFTTSHP